MKNISLFSLSFLLVSTVAMAQDPPKEEGEKSQQAESDSVAMDNARLDVLIKRIDPAVKGEPGRWFMKYEAVEVYVITDENADRMRIMTPITNSKDLDAEVLYRMMQANFDSALDARYAIANEILWSAFIHPLSSLSDKEFFSGLAQTIVTMTTFGTTYSSGALIFQGGDSKAEQNRYYQEIMKKGLELDI